MIVSRRRVPAGEPAEERDDAEAIPKSGVIGQPGGSRGRQAAACAGAAVVCHVPGVVVTPALPLTTNRTRASSWSLGKPVNVLGITPGVAGGDRLVGSDRLAHEFGDRQAAPAIPSRRRRRTGRPDPSPRPRGITSATTLRGEQGPPPPAVAVGLLGKPRRTPPAARPAPRAHRRVASRTAPCRSPERAESRGCDHETRRDRHGVGLLPELRHPEGGSRQKSSLSCVSGRRAGRPATRDAGAGILKLRKLLSDDVHLHGVRAGVAVRERAIAETTAIRGHENCRDCGPGRSRDLCDRGSAAHPTRRRSGAELHDHVDQHGVTTEDAIEITVANRRTRSIHLLRGRCGQPRDEDRHKRLRHRRRRRSPPCGESSPCAPGASLHDGARAIWIKGSGSPRRRRGYTSARPGPLAQLVEQGTLNPKVEGSNPSRPI